ncbi:mechanosensitive ion channel family protein [Balneola sp. MJW-20]|uniref:mechanosensitive ion channel family protein n=1 Tax=Gracilimonas aurantiaca TaxID=3234185 RepID=UPI003467A987
MAATADAQSVDSLANEVISVVQDSTASEAEPAKKAEPKISELGELISFNKILLSVFVVIFAFLFNKALAFLLGRLAEVKAYYRLLVKRLIPFLNILIWSLAIYIVIEGVIDPPVETLLAVGASVGIAVGFAAQDILKNIFGGFIIIMDRPFQIGDKIDVNGHYGEVTEIGLRSIRIQTPDDSSVTIPNAEIVNNSVSNTNSGALFCQVVTSIYLPNDVPIDEIKALAYKAAITSRYVYLNKPVVVLAEHRMMEQRFAIELKVKAYVLDIRYEFKLKSEITEFILKELNQRKLINESPSENHENT